MDLVSGLAVVPVQTSFGHQFIPKWDLWVPCKCHSCPPGAGILNSEAQCHFSQLINIQPAPASAVPIPACPSICPSFPPFPIPAWQLSIPRESILSTVGENIWCLSLAYLPRVFWGLIRGGKAVLSWNELGKRITSHREFIPWAGSELHPSSPRPGVMPRFDVHPRKGPFLPNLARIQ